MKREWKPGDVRLIFVEGKVRLFRYRPDAENPWVLDQDYGPYLHSNWTEAQLVEAEGRELVLIDPEDREQVARLADAFCNARWSHLPDSDECDPLTRSMQGALRSLVEPPKPEEPQGLGAVVEASAHTDEVRTFVRCSGDGGAWSDSSGNFHTWSELDVVRILADGWTPDAPGGVS